MKDYNKKKESSYIQYWDVNDLFGWVMSQTVPVNNFEWINNTSQFNVDFIRNYNAERDEGYWIFPRSWCPISKICHRLMKYH